MKQEMKSTARLAVTAGLCTSLALGGLPLKAIAAEVVVDPASAAAAADAHASATDAADTIQGSTAPAGEYGSSTVHDSGESSDAGGLAGSTEGVPAGRADSGDGLNAGGEEGPAFEQNADDEADLYGRDAGPLASSEVEVETQAELRAALDSDDVTKIALAADISMDGHWVPAEIKAGRTLLIEGNGHTISGMKAYYGVLKPSGSGVPGDGGSCDYYCGFIGNTSGSLVIQNLKFANAESDIKELDTDGKSTGSSMIAIVVGSNQGSLVLENVEVENSVARGYTKVGGLIGFSQEGSSASIVRCAVRDTQIGLEADGTDPEGCFTGVIAGYNGANTIKTEGVILEGNTTVVDESIDWKTEIKKDSQGIRYVEAYGNKWGLTCETYSTGGNAVSAVKMVASTGGYLYESIGDAIGAAQDGDTIQILEDCKYELQVIDGKNLTVDLGGHVLISTKFGFMVKDGSLILDDTSESKAGVVRVVESNVTEVGVVLDEGGSFTMKGGKIESTDRGVHANSGDGIVISIEGGSISAPNGIFAAGKGALGSTKIFVKGGCIKGENAAVLTNGSSPGGVAIDISGGTLEATNTKSTAVYLPGVGGKTTITGGTITGATGVEIRAGELVISGNPTIQGSGEFWTSESGSGGTTTGVGVAVAQHTTGEPINVIIEGDPKISGKYALYEHNPQKNSQEAIKKVSVDVAGGTFVSSKPDATTPVYSEDVTGFISGGTFTVADGVRVDEEKFKELCAEDYVPAKDDDGNYIVEVVEDKRVAAIDGRAYPTVQEALDAAKNGQTVKLLKGATENVVVAEAKSVILDLGGYDLIAPLADGMNKTSTIIVKGSLVLKDSTASGDPVVDANGAIAYVSGSVVCPKTTVRPFARPVIVEPGGSFALESGRLYAEDSDGVFVGTAGAEAGGSMVMKGGLIDAQEYGIGVISHSNLTVEGGLIRARNNAAVAGNGSENPSQGDTNITIKGGALRSESTSTSYIACGIYHPQSGTLTVSGGKIEAVGGAGILMRAGSAYITGGEIIASGSMSGYVGDSKVKRVPSSGIVVDRAANYGASTDGDVVSVSGSVTIKADEGQDALSTVLDESDSKKGLIAISGGELSSKPDLEYCADGYGPVQQPDGSFGVSTEQSYTVRHLFEAVDSDDYFEDELLAKPETLTGTIGEDTAAEAATVEGFTAQPVAQQKISADGSTVVEIKYTRDRHTVSFDSKGGTAVTEQRDVKYGARAETPADPTKEGSAFLGWYISGTFNKFDFNMPVTEDIQLVAHWVLNTYTVTLDANGGEPIEPIEISHGYDLAEPTATRTGYTLTGWKGADGKDVTFPITVTSDLALTAQWKLDAPKVALTADKAEPGVHAGDTVTLTANPEHALDGATYTYQWYKGREKIDGATEKTLEVSNEDGEYTVDVVAHDGKNASAAATSNSITLSFEKQGVAVSFARSEVEKHVNEIGATFVNGIALQARAIGGVSYESGDNAVATVDAKTGEVTIRGVGEATITAKVAETETHEAAAASYKLTVTDHDAGTWKTVKPATCTEAGEEQRVCGVCGEVLETRAIEKLTHAAAHVPAKAATCTEDGNIEHWSCESCGKLFADAACTDEIELTDTVEKALGHYYAEIVVDPTCTEGGYTVHECQRCGDSYTDSKTEALGHAEKLVGAADATCTEDGYTGDMVCSACGEVLQKGEVVPAAGHKVGAWKVTKEPTCTEVGREERVCSVCGEKESREIPSLGHKLEAVAEIPATIDAAGVKAHYKCTACGELFLDAEGKQGVDAAGLVIEKLEAVTVTFDDCFDPDTDQIVIRLAKGGVIADEDLPADPEHAGYEFAGWFLYDTTTHSWGDAFNPTAPVTADLLVGAKWKKVDEGTGDSGSTEKPADKPTKPSDEPGSGDKDALVQTGDSAFAQIVAAFSAGVAAIGAGLFSRRRRNE